MLCDVFHGTAGEPPHRPPLTLNCRAQVVPRDRVIDLVEKDSFAKVLHQHIHTDSRTHTYARTRTYTANGVVFHII